MTSVPGCCCDQTVSTGLMVQSGKPRQPLFYNEPNLKLFSAEIQGAIPPSGSSIYGTITTLSDNNGIEVETEVPFSLEPNSNSIQYFPYIPVTQNDDGSYTFPKDLSWKRFTRTYSTSMNEYTQSVRNSNRTFYNSQPFLICDCFSDALYTSASKTEDENNRAKILQGLCKYWNVGINARYLTWKPSLYLGTHNTTIEDFEKRTLDPGKAELLRATETKYFEEWNNRHQNTVHLRSIILPKSLQPVFADLKKSGPVSVNYNKLRRGSLTVKPPDYPLPGQRPHEPGAPHDSAWSNYYYMWRLLYGAAYYGTRLNNIVRTSAGAAFGGDVYDTDDQFYYPEGEYRPIIHRLNKDTFNGVCTWGASWGGGPGRDPCYATNHPDDPRQTCEGTCGTVAPITRGGYTYDIPEDTRFTITYRNNVFFYGEKDGSLANTNPAKTLLYYTVGTETDRAPLIEYDIPPGTKLAESCHQDEQGCCAVFRTGYVEGFLNNVAYPYAGNRGNAHYKLTQFSFKLNKDPVYISSKTNLNSKTVSHQLYVGKNYGETNHRYDRCTPPPVLTTILNQDTDHAEEDTAPGCWWATDNSNLGQNKNIGSKQITIDITKQYYQGIRTELKPYHNNTSASLTELCDSNAPRCELYFLCKHTVIYIDSCGGSYDNIEYYRFGCSCEEPVRDCGSGSGSYEDSETGEQCAWSRYCKVEKVPYCSVPGSGENNWCCNPTIPTLDECGNPIPDCGYPIPAVTTQSVETTEYVPNPFIYFDTAHVYYSDILNNLAPNSWRLVERDYGNSSCGQYCERDIHVFSKLDYFQSLVTNLYGRDLEYGSLKLKTQLGKQVNWPQAMPISFSNKPIETTNATGETNKAFMKTILQNRTSLFPGNTGGDREKYWKERIVYELTDYFSVPGLTLLDGITTTWYPEGLPDLKYSDKRLQIASNGYEIKREILGITYDLNWFETPIQNVLRIE